MTRDPAELAQDAIDLINDLLQLAQDAIDLIPPSYSERGPLIDRLADLKDRYYTDEPMSDEAIHVALSSGNLS